MRRLTESPRVATEAAQPAAGPDWRGAVVGVAGTEAEVRRAGPPAARGTGGQAKPVRCDGHWRSSPPAADFLFFVQPAFWNAEAAALPAGLACRQRVATLLGPRAARIGAPAVGWLEDEIDGCIKTIKTCPRTDSGRWERTGR